MRSIQTKQESGSSGFMPKIACIVKPATSNPWERELPGWCQMAVMDLNFKTCNSEKII
jgi:hypothetical protein